MCLHYKYGWYSSSISSRYHSNTYANLGKYYYTLVSKRPDLSYRVTDLEELALTHSRFAIEGHKYAIPAVGPL